MHPCNLRKQQFYTGTVVLKLEHALETPTGLVTAQVSGPTPGVSALVVWAGTQECAFLTSSQVMLLLLIVGPHFENQKCRVKKAPSLQLHALRVESSICLYLTWVKLDYLSNIQFSSSLKWNQ